MRSTFAERLKEAMEMRNIKQNELSAALHIPKSAISQYLSGKFEAKQDRLYEIAKYLDVSETWLMGYDVSVKPSRKLNLGLFGGNNQANTFIFSDNEKMRIKKIRALDEHGKKVVDFIIDEEYRRCSEEPERKEKVISIRHSEYKVSAGHGSYLGDSDRWETIDVPDTGEARRADFAITIVGDSMEPVYFNGDVILVKKQTSVDINQLGIFILNEEGYIKKFGGDRLISLNEKYDDIFLTENDSCKCVGKVIGRV